MQVLKNPPLQPRWQQAHSQTTTRTTLRLALPSFRWVFFPRALWTDTIKGLSRVVGPGRALYSARPSAAALNTSARVSVVGDALPVTARAVVTIMRVLSLLLFGAAATTTTLTLLVGHPSSAAAGIVEDRAAALASHRKRLQQQKDYHTPDYVMPDHRGHPGHGGEHMNEVPHEVLLEHHQLHHHEVGHLPVKHRLPPGQHDLRDHERPDKDQRGDHHNPPEMRHVLIESDMHDFGIDMHTGRKRIKMSDLAEHVWDKDDPDHPHSHRRATKRHRRRKFPNHPRRKYDWMEDETRRLAHEHTLMLRAGNVELAEQLAHNQSALGKELRHLEMLHHGMTEEEYQEFKGWQLELDGLNEVDSHALEREEKVKHRDRMVELAKLIRETSEHFEMVRTAHRVPRTRHRRTHARARMRCEHATGQLENQYYCC